MTVKELMQKLKYMPQDATVLVEYGEEPNHVTLECCRGNRYVRLYEAEEDKHISDKESE